MWIRPRLAALTLAVALVSIAPPAAGATGIHLERGVVDGNGCQSLEVWNGGSLVKTLEQTGAGVDHCWTPYTSAFLPNGVLLFDWEEPSAGSFTPAVHLWRSDGTVDGTLELTHYGGFKCLGAWKVVGAAAFISEWCPAEAGNDLTVTRGTLASTFFLPGADVGFVRRTSDDLYLVLGDRIVYVATHPKLGREVFVSDGTRRGSHVVRDIWRGPHGSGPSTLRLLPGGKRIRFSASDGSGRAPWITDGRAAGTHRIR